MARRPCPRDELGDYEQVVCVAWHCMRATLDDVPPRVCEPQSELLLLLERRCPIQFARKDERRRVNQTWTPRDGVSPPAQFQVASSGRTNALKSSTNAGLRRPNICNLAVSMAAMRAPCEKPMMPWSSSS